MTLRDWNNMDESTVSADTIVDFKDLSTHYLNSRENRVLVVLYFYLFYYYYYLFFKQRIIYDNLCPPHLFPLTYMPEVVLSPTTASTYPIKIEV